MDRWTYYLGNSKMGQNMMTLFKYDTPSAIVIISESHCPSNSSQLFIEATYHVQYTI
jgi:hypothetical protein